MIDDKHLQLMNRVVEGTGSDDDRAALEKLLAENQEARSCYEDLKIAMGALERVRPAETPSDLKGSIMRAVRRSRRVQTAAVPRWTLTDSLRRLFSLSHGLSFVAGAAAALLAFSLWIGQPTSGPSLDPSHLTGTIMLDGISEGLAALDRDTFNLDGVVGSIETRVTGSVLLIDIEARSTAPNEIILEFEPEQFRYAGFRQLGHPESRVTARDGQVTMNLAADHHYTLFFDVLVDAPTEAVSCRVCSEGLIYEEQLETRPRPEHKK